MNQRTNIKANPQSTKVNWIHTHGGRRFTPAAPWAGDIAINDIAHALSNLCRFGGHCDRFYSVAQHSVLVSRLVQPKYRMHALLHDASEAYLVDLPRPIKLMPAMSAYRDMELAVQRAVYGAFNVRTDPESDIEVDHADNVMLATEARDLLPKRDPADWASLPKPARERISPMQPKAARAAFLAAFVDIVAMS